ncbi:hypothetical protein [Candidatus Electronema sp. PJ]|uniref:hypothetical protein n=1 Tax=Candidatus Electronema sp. PJ TaxID=3401572 RepID=UPI003AA88D71
MSLTNGIFNRQIEYILSIIDKEPVNIYLAGSRNGYKESREDSDLDLLMEFTPEDAKDVCRQLEKHRAERENLSIKSLITHAQFGRFFCCYDGDSSTCYIDLGIVTSEYLEIYLIGAPISKINASIIEEPAIERDYRQYIKNEIHHLIMKARKALARNNITSALAHSSRYLFLAGINIDQNLTAYQIISTAIKHYEYQAHGKDIR